MAVIIKHKLSSFFICRDIKNWKAPNSPDKWEAIAEGLIVLKGKHKQGSRKQTLLLFLSLWKFEILTQVIMEVSSDYQVILTLILQEYANQRRLAVQMLFS